MGLYLLNATLIWGFSLLAYELLFRNETVHHWNRAYLLLTLGLGLVLPLWTWHPAPQPDAALAFAVVPVAQVAAAKATVVQTAAPHRAQAVFSWWLLYGAGVAASLLWTARDALRIAALYRAGTKTRHTGWTLVETGREHPPFSFFHWVFLPSLDALAPGDRALVLQHERRHGALLHSLDVLVLQLVQIALPFHPLVYWYRRRLALVHEYQADAAAGADVQAYGRLLLTQGTGAPLPPFVQSFNRSPLKNRIAMLVKHPSGAVRLLRYAATVPLVVGCALFCSRVATAQEKIVNGSKLVYNGNRFILTKPVSGELRMNDAQKTPVKGVTFTVEPRPEKMNGQAIFGPEELTTPARYTGTWASAADQFFEAIQEPLSKLPDGRYVVDVFTPVISADGKLAYYTTRGVHRPGVSVGYRGMAQVDSILKSRQPIDPALKKSVDDAVEVALRQPFSFKPATRKGVAVASYLDADLDLGGRRQIEVKDGQARLVPRLED